MPFNRESLRLRVKSKGGTKGGEAPAKVISSPTPKSKLGKQKPKLGKVLKPKLGKDAPSSADRDTPDSCTSLVKLSKSELCSPLPLELRVKRFVYDYLTNLNATQATIHGGYSSKVARQIGGRLMTKASIKTDIAIAQAAREKCPEIDANRALSEAWS